MTTKEKLLQEYAQAERAVQDAEERRARAWQDIINSLPADEAVELLERRTANADAQ